MNKSAIQKENIQIDQRLKLGWIDNGPKIFKVSFWEIFLFAFFFFDFNLHSFERKGIDKENEMLNKKKMEKKNRKIISQNSFCQMTARFFLGPMVWVEIAMKYFSKSFTRKFPTPLSIFISIDVELPFRQHYNRFPFSFSFLFFSANITRSLKSFHSYLSFGGFLFFFFLCFSWPNICICVTTKHSNSERFF